MRSMSLDKNLLAKHRTSLSHKTIKIISALVDTEQKRRVQRATQIFFVKTKE
jgi:hypothetical protein